MLRTAMWMGWRFAVGPAAVLLVIGGLRSLRRQSGGLRLLTGAWGFAAGILSLPLALWPTEFGIGALAPLLPLPALAGLALTVMHKEQK
ncbi:MAG: hypothetical protein ACREH4_05420 [Vitreimonas sp.]